MYTIIVIRSPQNSIGNCNNRLNTAGGCSSLLLSGPPRTTYERLKAVWVPVRVREG